MICSVLGDRSNFDQGKNSRFRFYVHVTTVDLSVDFTLHDSNAKNLYNIVVDSTPVKMFRVSSSKDWLS